MPSSETRESFLAKYWLYLIASFAFAAALTGLYFCPETSHWHGVIEAILIAASLTLTVDPFVKKRLTVEVSKNIFYHVLGFNLPDEMQDRLRTYLRDLKYYRTSFSLIVEALEITDHEVIIEVRLAAEIEVLTKCSYSPSLSFEKAEQGAVHEIWSRRKASLQKLVCWERSQPWAIETNVPLTTVYRARDPNGHPANLHRGDKLESFFRFELQGRKVDYWVQTFGTTTAKTDINLIPLPGMKMYTSRGDPAPLLPGQTGERYLCDEVLVVGEDIHIRWEVSGQPVHTAPAGAAQEKPAYRTRSIPHAPRDPVQKTKLESSGSGASIHT